jgi:hypothetical protein
MRPLRIIAHIAITLVIGASAGEAPQPDSDKTFYAGQITETEEFNRIVTARRRELEIQGGFIPPKSDPHKRWTDHTWDSVAQFSVGDTIDMEFHVGVAGTKLKLSTKSFPSPEPVLHLMEDGKEIKQLKFTKGAC